MSANPPDLEWEEKKVLIIGRASPEPSKKHFETVCTGGISEDGHLLRLYPIPLRYLEEEKHYRLWSWVKFDIQKNQSDHRKESYKIRQETITILSQVQSEAEQFSLLRKAVFPDREKLDELYHRDWTSLGVIEIEVIELATREAEKNWVVQKPYINQFDLFIERKPLDRSPFCGFRAKPITIPESFRSPFRTDSDHDSGVSRSPVPKPITLQQASEA